MDRWILGILVSIQVKVWTTLTQHHTNPCEEKSMEKLSEKLETYNLSQIIHED